MPLRATQYHLLVAALLLSAATACMRAAPTTEPANPAMGQRQPRTGDTIQVNVPTLIGQNIDQLRRTLGAPREPKNSVIGPEPTPQQQRATQADGWINTFEYNGLTIVATFNPRTRKVRDLVLLGSDEEELMRRGNLSLVSTAYLVLPVNLDDESTTVTGVRVVSRD